LKRREKRREMYMKRSEEKREERKIGK
jgi:hypothetical protein